MIPRIDRSTEESNLVMIGLRVFALLYGISKFKLEREAPEKMYKMFEVG